MNEDAAPGPRLAAGTGGPATGYTPLVPTFSPYTSEAGGAIRLAWRVTLGAFLLLAALVTGIPVARNWYVNAAIEPRGAFTTPIDGVVFLRRQGTGDWLAARPDEKIVPGDVIRTAQNARAFVTLFDQSTVLLYPSSTLRVLRAEEGRFRRQKRSVVLELSQGRARLGVAPAADPAVAFFQLRTPQAEVHLGEGSYSADVSKEGTQVSARFGEATAHTAQGSAQARGGQRLVAPTGGPPSGAQPLRRDLVSNGLFAEREGALPSSWQARVHSDQAPEGSVSLNAQPGAVTFRRQGTGHAETAIYQILDADLWDFERVVLSAEIRILDHSLSGGGWQGTEYPLMLKVTYRDNEGGIIPWYRGYYRFNRDNNPVRSGVGFGEQVASSDWQQIQIDLLAQAPRPWRLQRVEVVAEGWDYESAIRELHVWAE